MRINLALLCLSLTALFLAKPALAALMSFASLSPGQTTQDGRLTFVAMRTVDGGVRVRLRNNDYHPVLVNSYRLVGGNIHECFGTKVRIAANDSRALCAIAGSTAAAETNIGGSSPALLVTWQTVVTPAFSTAPSPTPFPSPLSTAPPPKPPSP